jgi:hypothetical protein
MRTRSSPSTKYSPPWSNRYEHPGSYSVLDPKIGFPQVQGWEQDPKLEKIAKLLWDERRLEAPTVEDHRKFRQQAEEILGPDESLFRIDWVSLPPPV